MTRMRWWWKQLRHDTKVALLGFAMTVALLHVAILVITIFAGPTPLVGMVFTDVLMVVIAGCLIALMKWDERS